jgi:hypothetical protein
MSVVRAEREFKLGPSALIVAGVFLLCFSIPFLITVQFGRSLFGFIEETELEPDPEDVFPASFRVGRPGDVLRVAHDVGITPRQGDDFLFWIWVRMRSPLEPGQRAAVVGKYDPKSKQRIGFSLAFERDLDGVRPMVYWRDEQGRGDWYSFAPLQMSQRSWVMVAVSFRESRYLGVHAAELSPGAPIQLLGGYELEGGGLPTNSSDLVLGAFGTSPFRGRIGPVGVISKAGLSDHLVDLLQEIRVARDCAPPAESNFVRLFLSGALDHSAAKLRVMSLGSSGFGRRDGSLLASQSADEGPRSHG